MHIDFDKVNKRGYDNTRSKEGVPLIMFTNPEINPDKEMSLSFMVDTNVNMIIATVSEPNYVSGIPIALYTIAMNITDTTTEDTLDKFFEFAADYFFKSVVTDDKDLDRKMLVFLKESNLDIQLIKLKDSAYSDKSCRPFHIEGNPKAFIENVESDSILCLSVKGYGVFELYNDHGVLFNIPDGFGTDENVTSDITHILKCLKEFRNKINVLDLFPTVEQKCDTFTEHINGMVEELIEGLSPLPLEEDNDV